MMQDSLLAAAVAVGVVYVLVFYILPKNSIERLARWMAGKAGRL